MNNVDGYTHEWLTKNMDKLVEAERIDKARIRWHEQRMVVRDRKIISTQAKLDWLNADK